MGLYHSRYELWSATIGLSHPRNAWWAAQDGRVDDLVFHLQHAGGEALKPSPRCPKRQSALHVAASRGNAQCVKVLCEAGSSLNCCDKDGHTPLHLASVHHHLGCVRVLLTAGAKPHVKTRFGVAPLHLACSSGSSHIVELLVQSGADIDAQESWGQTPLAVATLRRRVDCMKVLLQLGANADVKDFHHGQTALHIACGCRDEESVLVLLDGGCDIQAVNRDGLTALGVAMSNRFYRGVPLLLEYGARLSDGDCLVTPEPLRGYINQLTDTPRSLLSLSRVAIRRSVDPASKEALGLPQRLNEYVFSVLEVCDGRRVQELAVEGHSLRLFPEPRENH